MNKSLIALALCSVFATPALAQATAPTSPHTFTGNVTLASDYVFRGISQSQHNPAIQGGFDYSHSSGLYLGTWASNVSWPSDTNLKKNNSLEWDFYGGYKLPLGDFTVDLGALHYYYPGTVVPGAKDVNSTEVYAGLSWKFLSLKYSHTVSSHLYGWVSPTGKNSRGSGYWDLSATHDLGNGWGVNGHLGHQTIKNFTDASYTDWKLGLTKDVGFGTVGLAYTGTDAKGKCSKGQPYCWNGKDVGDNRLVLTFSKTF